MGTPVRGLEPAIEAWLPNIFSLGPPYTIARLPQG
jgi:hypothetical protein